MGADLGCEPGAPTEERCDGLDNDCDGETDEDFELGAACTTPDCAAGGRMACRMNGNSAWCRPLDDCGAVDARVDMALPVADAGTDLGPDAADAGRDAADATPTTESDDGGCGCAQSTRGAPGVPLLLLILLLSALARFRGLPGGRDRPTSG